ncbi:restriction endonuclease [Azohydromonas caseinilytica]|uniref:Restriction endonuclease n=1 Tax=Azohydromonas caseinilytica TaxID=2728836 RepID=A0A848F9R8_9BURK|nr:restriction endonuclease [Azohydromonas caseinilytica]
MRLVNVRHLLHRGTFASSVEATRIDTDIQNGIQRVCWPAGSGSFTLLNTPDGNGVKPIKNDFIAHLQEQGWQVEQRMRIASRIRPGKVDAVHRLQDGRHFAVEWETGNISSSHRALNKMAVGLLDGCLAGGALVLPSRQMYTYLTDRTGNYSEIEPYFPMWESLVVEGVLSVYVVEYDALSSTAPAIPKGTDGRALR